MTYLFSSESVCEGHPDKVADQISDNILDACLRQDAEARVACEVMVSKKHIHIAGELSFEGACHAEHIAKEVVKKIGYDGSRPGFSHLNCTYINDLIEQSPDIAASVLKNEQKNKDLGAGDQGLMFGYACDESEEYMPLAIALCHKLVLEFKYAKNLKEIPYLGPDGKVQITVAYGDLGPEFLHTVLISMQHDDGVPLDKIQNDLKEFARAKLPKHLITNQTRFIINPSGRFVIGGPDSDCGLTGRKIIADTYGGYGRHGGGAFSGKDPTKVDRSGAYMARYVAKNIVASGLACRCEVQLAYGIGLSEPISIHVNTFGTGKLSDRELEHLIPEFFALSPQGIIDTLDLRRPIYQKTSFGGHFGRSDVLFSWENCDKALALDSLKDKLLLEKQLP